MKPRFLFSLQLVACVFVAGCALHPARQEATLVVTLSPPMWMNVWLSGEGIEERKLDDSDDIHDKSSGRHVFRHLTPGEYLIELDPDYEDWAWHCVGYANVVLDSGMNSVSIVIPTNKVTVTVVFPDSPPAFPKFGAIPLRVERLGSDGVDPIYKQWLWVSKKTPYSGSLHYLAEGTYRITCFAIDFEGDWKRTDLFHAEVAVDQKVLTGGKIQVNMKEIESSNN